jgi:hypothetical protein
VLLVVLVLVVVVLSATLNCYCCLCTVGATGSGVQPSVGGVDSCGVV